MANSSREIGFDWYVTFISIVFGVFISVWIQPFAGEHFETVQFVLVLRGFIMFMILVCLWWWYAFFLGQIEPANGFLMYLYDFTTLASFAIGFRFWDQPNLFPLSVLLGAGLMLVRFVFARNCVDRPSPERDAMVIAFRVLSFIIVFLAGIAGAAFYFNPGGDPTAIKTRLAAIHFAVMVLLAAGIIGTLLAVRKAEGLRWGHRRVLKRSADR